MSSADSVAVAEVKTTVDVVVDDVTPTAGVVADVVNDVTSTVGVVADEVDDVTPTTSVPTSVSFGPALSLHSAALRVEPAIKSFKSGVLVLGVEKSLVF